VKECFKNIFLGLKREKSRAFQPEGKAVTI
jgi:hypothetical protein